MTTKQLEAIHPGEILRMEVMAPLGWTARRLALALRVPPTRIEHILRGQRPITIGLARRLSTYFGTTTELWLGLQTESDLRLIRRSLAETSHLLRSPRNRARLLAALKRASKPPRRQAHR